jgi:hypothetical protein
VASFVASTGCTLPPVASLRPSRARQRGTIGWLPSGSARVKVCAGIDQLTGKKIWLRRLMPRGRRVGTSARPRWSSLGFSIRSTSESGSRTGGRTPPPARSCTGGSARWGVRARALHDQLALCFRWSPVPGPGRGAVWCLDCRLVLSSHLRDRGAVLVGQRFQQRGLHDPVETAQAEHVLGEKVVLDQPGVLGVKLRDDGARVPQLSPTTTMAAVGRPTRSTRPSRTSAWRPSAAMTRSLPTTTGATTSSRCPPRHARAGWLAAELRIVAERERKVGAARWLDARDLAWSWASPAPRVVPC